jgi:hypothetical protein
MIRIDRKPQGSLTAAVVLASLAITAVVAPAIAPAKPDPKPDPGVKLRAILKGKNEVPGPGDPTGTGKVGLVLNAKKARVCFTLSVSDLAPITAGFIVEGGRDEVGEVTLRLFKDAGGLDGDGSFDQRCLRKVDKKLIRSIASEPDRYFVNIRNNEYPDGAVRGPLKPK